MTLPVTVIIPTLNCRDSLEKHLDAIEPWLSHVAEIIAVDSNSTDGTTELLHERILPLGGKVIRTGPGLYKAWNLAAQQAQQPYLYYATIGDIITLDGLKKLWNLSSEHQLDLVISAPKVISESGESRDDIQWPIHYFNEFLERNGGFFIPDKQQRVLLSTLFIPQSIIGSSASNLYRAGTLKKYPFPEDVGHTGDVFWCIRYLAGLNIGLLSEQLAFFSFDTQRTTSWEYLYDCLFKQVESIKLTAHQKENQDVEFAYSLAKCSVHQTLQTQKLVLDINNHHRPWWGKIKKSKRIYNFEKSISHYSSRLQKLRYRLNNKLISPWDPLLILETFHPMQLGSYEHYYPKKVQYDILPKLASVTLPSIAIVTPSYNQGSYLGETIDSVLAQNYPKLQYAVIDGGSNDESPNLIEHYKEKLTYSVSEPDQGQSDAIIKGFSHLDGEIMAYLNSDDLLAPGALDYVGAFFAHNPEVDVVYGHRIIVNEKGEEMGRWVLPRHNKEAMKYFDLIPQETMFWRKSLYDSVEGIDRNKQFAMDWDLILKFQNAGARFWRLPYFLGCFRAHSNQKSQTWNEVGMREIKELVTLHGGDADFGERYNRQHRRYRRRAMLTTLLMSLGIRS